MFRNHLNVRGVWYREHYKALDQRLGPFDQVSREYAGAVAALWCEFRGDTLALEAAELARREGQGRRPSTQAIARLKKRAALSWGSYDQALVRLEALTVNRPRPSFADAVRAGGQR
jgi:hypothetical protein